MIKLIEMNITKAKHSLLILLAISLTACVTQKQFNEVKDQNNKCQDEVGGLRKENQSLTTQKNELEAQMTEMKKKFDIMCIDTGTLGRTIRLTTSNYDKLNATYELLNQKSKELLSGNEQENKKLMKNLQSAQEELQKRQDELKKLSEELNDKKKNLDATKSDLDKTQLELKAREQKVMELEAMIKQKDQAVADLKKKVQDALTGFEGKGLTITQKNGKIYVSLDESLLFASGSTNVEAKGIEAIKKLAKVLEQNPDVNVLVEGHTDDVPMTGKGEIKDNWDLSAMRASSIVKIITKNSTTDPHRLTAAGRGEYFPLDPAKTAEARKKNRRTEIILTPKLDELLKVLETN